MVDKLNLVRPIGAAVLPRHGGAGNVGIRQTRGPYLHPSPDGERPRVRWDETSALGRADGFDPNPRPARTASGHAEADPRHGSTAHQVLERIIGRVTSPPLAGRVPDKLKKTPDEARKQATTLISGCNWDEALSLMKMLRTNNIPPNVFNYGALMGRAKSEFDRERASVKVLEIYDDMLKHDVHPNLRICTTVITALGRQGRANEAEEVFRAMEKRGERADIEAFGALMSAYATQGGEHAMAAIRRLYRELMQRPEGADKHRLGGWLLGLAKADLERPAVRNEA